MILFNFNPLGDHDSSSMGSVEGDIAARSMLENFGVA
jgi:hypothetical protein